jgi:hypothetical protein
LLVYGLSNAATTPDGVSHWGDAKVIASLVAAVVLLAAFAVIEARSRDPLLPVRVLRSRDRAGAYLVSLCTGTALLAMFFFLTLFVQDVWGYSALKTSLAYLPFVAMILAATVITQRAVTRVGARPLLIAGSAVSAGGMVWLSRITEHSTFAGGMLGPELVLAAGLGPKVVLTLLVGLTKVRTDDAGVASGLVDIGQQAGGAIGLAVIGTVAWSAVASSLRSQAAAAARAGVPATGTRAAAAQTQIYHHALAAGFSRGYLVSAGIMTLIVIIALAVIRVSRQDLSGTDPMPEPAGDATRQAGHQARAQAAACSHDLGAGAPHGDDDRVQQTARGVRFGGGDRGRRRRISRRRREQPAAHARRQPAGRAGECGSRAVPTGLAFAAGHQDCGRGRPVPVGPDRGDR